MGRALFLTSGGPTVLRTQLNMPSCGAVEMLAWVLLGLAGQRSDRRRGRKTHHHPPLKRERRLTATTARLQVPVRLDPAPLALAAALPLLVREAERQRGAVRSAVALLLSGESCELLPDGGSVLLRRSCASWGVSTGWCGRRTGESTLGRHLVGGATARGDTFSFPPPPHRMNELRDVSSACVEASGCALSGTFEALS